MVAGFDFCFSFPAWFLREVGAETAPDFWSITVAERGEQWLRPRKRRPALLGQAA